MQEYKRTDRVAHLIQRELAQLIQQSIKDPDLPDWVTVSKVVVSSDLSHAKVYFTVLKPELNAPVAQRILKKSANYLRNQLGKILRLRSVPTLHFIYDTSLQEQKHLDDLLDNVPLSDTEPPDSDDN